MQLFYPLSCNLGFPDYTTSGPVKAEQDVQSEATLLANEEDGFALEPVAVTRKA